MKRKQRLAGGKETLKKLLPLVGKYWPALLLSTLLAAGAVVLQLYIPVLFGEAIDQIVAAGQVNFVQMGEYLGWILVLIAAASL